MKVSFGQMVQDLKRRSQRRRMSLTVILVLSLFVSTGIVWKLRSVGITMVNDAECGIEEHVHNELCYKHNFICGMDETSDSDDAIGNGDENRHIHDINCFTEELICDKAEHTHSLECFGDESLVEKLKDRKDSEVQVVEIPGAYVVGSDYDKNRSYDDINKNDYENSDSDAGSDADSEEMIYVDEDESRVDTESDDVGKIESGDEKISEEEFDLIMNQLRGQVGARNLMGEMRIIPETETGVIHMIDDNNKHVSVSNPLIIYKGETVKLCCYGTSMLNRWPFFINSGRDVIDATNNEQDNSDGLQQRTSNVTGKSVGSALIQCDYASDTAYANEHGDSKDGYQYYVRLSINVKQFDTNNLNKIFLVNPDGTEVEAESVKIKQNETATFCIYTDEDGQKVEQYIYSNDGSRGVSASDSDKISRTINMPQEDGSTKVIRRYEVTYKFSQTGNFKINNDITPSVNVVVSSNESFNSFDKLYHIYWVKDNNEEVLDDIPYIIPGQSATFCIYTDYKNTISNAETNEEHNLYVNEGSEDHNNIKSSNYKKIYYEDTRNGVPANSLIRRLQVTFTFNKPGDFDVLYSAVTSHKVYVNSSDPCVLLKTGNTYVNLTENANYTSDTKRYLMEYGDEIELIAYGDGVFKNSLDSAQNEKKNIEYSNEEDTNGTVRIVRTHIKAADKGNSELSFGGTTVIYLDVKERIVNDIYVVTQLGERLKDKVHERGTTYEPNSNTDENRYILYVDEDSEYYETVQVCIYTDKSNSNSWFWSEKDKYYYDNGEKKTRDDYCIEIANRNVGEVYGYRKVMATINAEKPGICAVKFDKTGTGTNAYFYVEVRSYSQQGNEFKDHADIEIADGGYYEVNREVYSDNNNKKTVYYERYDSFISGVTSCKILGPEKNNDGKFDYNSGSEHYDIHYEFKSEDYTPTGNRGEQQYELNSKQVNNGRKLYDRFKVRKVIFDVSVTMIPTEKTKTVYIKSDNGQWVQSGSVVDVNDKQNRIIDSLIFEFGQIGIADALNKCSDHSGMDFNVTGRLNEVVTQISFPVEKVFENEKAEVLSNINKTFEFQISGSDGTFEKKENDSKGDIRFSELFVQRDSDSQLKKPEAVEDTVKTYHYTIKELIPDGADEGRFIYYENDKYGIRTDDKVYDVYVKTFVNPKTNLMETEYYSDDKYTDKFDEKIVFRNVVCNDLNGSFTVTKMWSDGNDKHNSDPIEFSIYRTDENNNRSKVVLSGDMWQNQELLYRNEVFHISSKQNWSVNIENLPFRQEGHTYKYWVEELNVKHGYLVSYAQDGNNWTITNSPQDDISITVRKQWLDVDGKDVTSEMTDNRYIEYNLKREVRTSEVSLKIQVKDINGEIKDERTVRTMYNGTVNFEVSSVRPPALEKMLNCYCKQTGNKYTVTGIKYDAVIVLNSDLLYHCTFDERNYSTYHEWKPRDVDNLNYGTSTVYAGEAVLKSEKRTGEWQGPMIDISEIVKSGQSYSISAYVLCKYSEINGGNYKNGNTITPKLTLLYCGDDGNEKTPQEITRFNGTIGNWIHMQKTYTIPSDAKSNIRLLIETTNENKETINGNEYWTDMYIDEVIIAPGTTDISVDKSGKVTSSNRWNDNNSFAFNNVINNLDTTWNFDCYVAKNYRLQYSTDSDNNWCHTFDKTELTDLLGKVSTENPKQLFLEGRDYRYIVEEDRLVCYYPPEYISNGVASNTQQTPIIIQNKQMPSYTLPPTGGSGTIKYTISGMTFIFAASAGIIYRRRRKHKSSA